ncbi:MAG: hypothetical protein CBD63_00210 [Candidatus Pelagibacter sp. TMED203]|nr:MAG: hypothetical protein CBD63_00210 [Candidatus Pelagibacter sp. TMED203]
MNLNKKAFTDNLKSFLYLISIAIVMITLLFTKSVTNIRDTELIVTNLAKITDIPNTVTSVILGTRLFDTIGEVTVFTLAGLGVKILLHDEESEKQFFGITDSTVIQLLDLSALLCAFLAIELAIRGHLTPGGGFASGVSGATAITLLMITGRIQSLENFYFKYNSIAIEKFAVVIFIIVSILSFYSILNPPILGVKIHQDILIPALNIICALKVTFGTWSIIRLFILKRGLLN